MITSWAKKAVVCILCIETVFFIAPKILWNSEPGAILVSTLGDLTNIERGNENLPPLKVNPLLNAAAELKAKDMAANGYFAHTSPEGKTPWYWLDLAGYKYDYAGENLAINFTDTDQVTDAWMKSPTHRANIVKRQYTEMGSGIATGTYLGKEAVFVVQVYGNQRVDENEIVASPKEVNTEITDATNGNVLGAETSSDVSDENLKGNITVEKSKVLDLIILISLYSISIGLIVNIFLRWNVKHHKTINSALFIGALVLFLLLLNGNIGNKEIYNNAIDYAQSQTY